MIRTENFAVSRETFTAGRRTVLNDAETRLRPHVEEALSRLGLPSWEQQITAAALDIFDLTARAEVDQWGQVIDDMRDLFAKELSDALKLTRTSEQAEVQLNTITGWVAQMSVNAGTEAATTSDPDPAVGLEWVTMGDASVRHAHASTAGQAVPTGMPFTVGEVEMMYPGQPVGDPANWINCRCVARPTMLEAADASRETFKSNGVPREDSAGSSSLLASADKPVSTSVIVALPAASDAVNAVSSEADGAHVTLAFLGESAAFDPAEIHASLAQLAGTFPATLTEAVNGTATLGKNSADVALLDAVNLAQVRSALLMSDYIAERYAAVEQFPAWIPHVTLGYPETPRLSEATPSEITFDRLALWHGEDRTEYPLGGPMPVHPEDPGFSQEMADAAFAALTGPEVEAEPALRPWHGVLAPEGDPSGDNRQFAERALTTRDLPLPLKAMFTDDEGHKGSVVVGRIDEVFRDGGLIKANGVYDNSPEADKAAGMIERKMWRGVSVDLDAAEGQMVEAADGVGAESIEFTQGRISSATLCAIPAFAEAFIRNGSWADFANEPMPTGAMVEIPDWPAVSLVASAAPAISADFFRNPLLEEPTALSLGEDGHIFGHLAAWEACHIGYEVCTTAPPSTTDYAYFLTGQVFTDAGPVAVGQVTLGGGHASGGASMRAAIAHYDNTGTAVADITVGEDAHGVWFSGRLREDVTDKQIHELFAAGLSGDWRGVRFRGQESMELVAALAVNVQGFPIPRTRFAMDGTRQVSLVAAGIPKKAAVMEDSGRTESVNSIMASIRNLRADHIKAQFATLKGK